ncbi:MAG: methyltransferase domain-containing protein [Candidatus Saccharimonadales bacterium]
MSIALLFIFFAVIFICAFFIISGFRGAVWVPAFSKDLILIQQQLRLEAGMNVYEFGCGDARFLRQAARRGAISTGYEINPVMALIAKFLSYRANVTINIGDAWGKSFHSADVVFAFLMPEYMERLAQKMKKELMPGATVVTYVYPLPGMQHYLFEGNAYFYKIP